MTDELLPATGSADAESNATDEPPSRDATDRDATDRDATDRDATGRHWDDRDATGRRSRDEPERATDPPPDRADDGEPPECDRDPGDEDGGTERTDEREYRIERLRLWRTVVTLAVAVARLIRSL